jgi:Mrp family chromosome partitioning ATPase
MLASIPHGDPAPTDRDGRVLISDRHREAFRTLRTNLDLQSLDRPVRTILVASALPTEGKSSVVRNLALAYREAGLRVAVIEADLRQPSLPKMFRVRRDPGLTNVLSQQTTSSEALQTVAAGEAEGTLEERAPADGSSDGFARAQLVVMTSGPNPANPPAVLGATRAHEVLREVAGDHDIVLVDSPPLLAVSDAIPLLSVVDGTLMVARLGLTKRDAARRVMELIHRVPDARVLGVVANDVPQGRAPYAYYDYS